jgi:hypothetical protein
MLDQNTPEPIAEVVDYALLGTKGLCRRPPVGRLDIGAHWKRIGRKPDGAEVRQSGGICASAPWLLDDP